MEWLPLDSVGEGSVNSIAYSADGITWTGEGLTTFDSIGLGVASTNDIQGNMQIRQTLNPPLTLSAGDVLSVVAPAYYDVQTVRASITVSD